MHRVNRRGFSVSSVLVVAALVILAFLFFGSLFGSTSSGAGSAATSTDEASSTISQALHLSSWIAKEYAPQKH
ncbi:MAG TPA: hypothetical protein VMV50_02735 [Candidatus Paceibacterota bacterium]|nr:hypothetical protein [Candidatus Paceibacterota bacterium]